MPRLANKVAIVTGAGSGLGEAIARTLASEGAHVVAANRSEESGARLVEVIREHGGDATFVRTDVGSESEIRSLVETAAAISGSIDIVVNNAGSGVDILGPFWAVTSDAWDRAFAVNVRGMFLVAKYAFPPHPGRRVDHQHGLRGVARRLPRRDDVHLHQGRGAADDARHGV